MLNALTVDVEDYYHVSGCEQTVDRARWGDYASRVVANTERLLELLERYQTRGTFYVLGWVAEKFPTLVRRIRQLGHEIGSHSYWHRLVYRQTPEQFRQDLRQSMAAIQDAVGEAVTLYRAPSFSITARSRWALDILAEEGIRVDSSIYPVRHDRYGISDAPREIHEIRTTAGPMCEFPPSVIRCGGVNWPAAGGGYFRLYPFRVTRWCIARMNHQLRPALVYIHPWEIDPDQPRVVFPSPLARWRHYVNLHRTYDRFDRLLAAFSFGTVSDVVARHAPPATAG